MSARTRSLLAAAGWLAAAAVATAVGVFAISALGSGIVGGTARPMSSAQIDRALADSTPTGGPPTRSSPAPTTSPGPTAAGRTRVLATDGGSVRARCTGGTVRLLSWSPAQGYESDDVARGPARTARITFESDRSEIHVTVTCQAGTPTASTRTERDG